MKSRRKWMRYLLPGGLAAVALAMFLVPFKDAKVAEAAEELQYEKREISNDWYTLTSDPTDGHDNPDDDYKFELLLSPQPKDYKSVSPDSISELFNGLVNGLKEIVTPQVKFVEKTAPPVPKEVDSTLVPDEESCPRSRIIRGFIGDLLVDPDFVDDGTLPNAYFIRVGDFRSTVQDGNNGLVGSKGILLKDMIIYCAAYGTNGSVGPDYVSDIANRLQVQVGESGEVTPLGGVTVYSTLVDYYTLAGVYQPEQAALSDLQILFDETCEVARTKTFSAESLVRAFDGLEETEVPVLSFMDVIGSQRVLECVMDLFTNKNISVQYPIYFLNNSTKDTMNDICNIIQEENYDPVTDEGGFKVQDILDAFDLAGNSRLMSMYGSLTAYGADNIRVILGKPVDFGKYPIPIDHYYPQADTEDYLETGMDLMEVVMNNFVVQNINEGGNSIKVIYDGVEYTILEKPLVDGVRTGTMQLKTHNLVNLLNALPKMEDVRNFEDGEFKLNFKILIDLVISRSIKIDQETGELTDEQVPVVINFNVGFQNKDSKYLRKLAALLDDTFDLEFGFDEEQEFWIDLVTRNPNFVSNIYAWLCDSGVIENDNKFLNELWDIAFKPIKDIKEYIRGKEVETLVENLQDIDYHKALMTLTTAEELNKIFDVSGITDSMLERAVSLAARAIHKGATLSYDDVLDIVRNALGGLADKLDNDTLRNIYDKLQDLLQRIDEKELSIEMLQGITNESVYDYVKRLTGKENLILKIRDKVVKILDSLPEDIQEKSLMTYYVGDGEFTGELNFDEIPWEKMLKAVGGDKAWVLFDGMVVGEERPLSFRFNFDSYFKDLYSITYEWKENGEDMSKQGILHTGSDVKLFSGIEEEDGGQIVHWLDKDKLENSDGLDYYRVDEMVDYDVVVVPESIFEVSITDSITEHIYDGEGSLTVTPSSDYDEYAPYEYEYKWQKYDETATELDEAWVDVDSSENPTATEATLSVPNVLDSGTYRCVITNNEEREIISPTREIEILPKEVDITVAEWVDEGPFRYTGETRSVTIDETTIPEGVKTTVSYEGNEAVEMGEYDATATFELIDENNYCFKDDISTKTLHWKILVKALEFEAKWLDENEFEYDGSKHLRLIDPESISEVADVIQITYQTTPVLNEEYVDGGQTEIGSYLVKAIITSTDGSYISEGSIPDPAEFYIYKEVDLCALRWSDDYQFTYDGNAHGVEIINADSIPEIEITYSGDENSQTAVGDYETIATVGYAEGYDEHTIHLTHDNVSGEEHARSWSIKKDIITVGNVEWDYTGPFTYEYGVERKVDLVANSLPEHVLYKFVENDQVNKATNAGTYKATVELYIDPDFADSYELAGDSHQYSLIWEIHQKVINLDNVVWSTDEFTYDGNEKEVSIVSADNLELATITYEDSKATNAGNYVVVANFVSNDSNYVFANSSISHAYVINKGKIEVTNIVWGDETTVDFNGNTQEISVISYDNSDKVDVSYLTPKGGRDAGSYEVVAEFTMKSDYIANYELVGETKASNTLVIKPVELSSSDIIVWKTTTGDDYIYNGSSHKVWVEVVDDYSSVVEFGYVHNATKTHEATEAGEYTAQVVCSISKDEAGNYIIVDDTNFSYDWKIDKKAIVVSNITWGNDSFVYDGNNHEITANYDVTDNLSDVVKVSYSDNNKVNAGNYTAVVTFELTDTNNYEFEEFYDSSHNWKIDKKAIVVSNITWGNDSFVYDGNNHEITANYDVTDNLSDVVKVSYSGNNKVNAGNYTAVVTFELLDTNNYEFEESYESSHNWKIDPKHISFGSVTWSNDTFTYDGDTKALTVTDYDNKDLISVSVSNGEQVNAGEYQVVATFALNSDATGNYVLDGTNATHTLKINKAGVSVTGVVWSDGNLTYNGSVQSIELTSYEDDDLISASITGNEATNAGYYTAKVTFTVIDANNYYLEGISELEQNWVINKLGIAPSSATWTDEINPLTYNKESQSTEFFEFEYADLVDVTYVNNSGIDAGDYHAVALLALKEGVDLNNYYLVEDYIIHDFEIAKMAISVADVEWSYNPNSPYVYSGSEHSVTVVSYTNSDIIDFEYLNQGDFTNKATEIGDYVAKAEFSIKEEYKKNYVFEGENVALCNWSIVRGTVITYNTFSSVEKDNDNVSLATVRIENAIEVNPTLYANFTNGEAFKDAEIDFKALIGSNGEVKYSYELLFNLEGEEFEIGENTYTIKIVIPEDIRDGEFVIVVLNEDSTVSEVEAEIDETGKYAVISGDFAKNIGFITKVEPSKSLADNPQFIVLFIILGVGQLIFTVGTVIVVKKLRKSREEHSAN